MQQHQHMEEKKKSARVGVRSARDIHQSNVERELEDDARQLAELEEKLLDIRRQKQIRQERKEARQLMRIKNKRAVLIQRAWAEHVENKRGRAVDLIKKFIRTAANKQASIIGGWAARTLRRFAVKASYAWLEQKRRNELEMQELVRQVEEEERREMAAYALEEAVQRSLDSIYQTVCRNVANIRKKSSVLTPNRKKKMRSAHRILGPNILERQLDSDRPLSPITTPAKERSSPSKPAPCKSTNIKKPLPTNAQQSSIDTKNPHARSTVDKQLSPSRKPVIIKKPNPSEERKRKIAELHQKRLEDMETERLRRLERVEQQKAAAEAVTLRERLERQLEEEDKVRKREEFMSRLEEQQQQLAREAEIVRTIREKEKKEKETEDSSQKTELKLMSQHDNFYVITPKILGGGNMSLQRRLFARPHGAADETVSAVVSRANSSVPTRTAPRVSSAPYRNRTHSIDRSRGDSGGGLCAMEKSLSAGVNTFQVPGELRMTALRPTGPDGVYQHNPDDIIEAENIGNDLENCHRDGRESHNYGQPAKLPGDMKKKQNEKYLSQHHAKVRELDAYEMERKVREDEEMERKAEALLIAREQAQRRIADRAKAERERQLELERLEEQRRLSTESEAAKQAREATRKRVAERMKLEKARKVDEEEQEEAKKKKQAELLEKAHDLILKTKKMTYAMVKMKKRNQGGNIFKPGPPSTFGCDYADSASTALSRAPPSVSSVALPFLSASTELKIDVEIISSPIFGEENKQPQVMDNVEISTNLINSGAGKAMPWENTGRLVRPSLSSFGMGVPSFGPDVGLPVISNKQPSGKMKVSVKAVADGKKSGKVSELLDIVSRAREKLRISEEDTNNYAGIASAEKKFTAAYSAPIRNSKPSVNGTRHQKGGSDETSSAFKPLTKDEMIAALGNGYSPSPLSMDYPNFMADPVRKRLDVKRSFEPTGNKIDNRSQKINKKVNPSKIEIGNCQDSDASDVEEEVFGYEDMLNNECERLRSQLEKKIMSSLKEGTDLLSIDKEAIVLSSHNNNAVNITAAANDAFAEYMSRAEIDLTTERSLEGYDSDGDDEDLFGTADITALHHDYGGSLEEYEKCVVPF